MRTAFADFRRTFRPDSPDSERLTADQEREMARAIRRAEQVVREAIAGIEEADDILMR